MPSIMPVELESAAVRLEPLGHGHAAELLAAATQDRATYAFTKVPADAAQMASYVELALAEQAAGDSLPFLIRRRDTGEAVGTTRYMDIQYWALPGGPDPRDAPSVLEIGSTWLAASVQRTNVNTETKLLLLTHAFEEFGVCRVSLITDARNDRSRAAIARLGATYEGVRRAHKLGSDGTIRDSAYFSITAAEWPSVKPGLVDRLGRA